MKDWLDLRAFVAVAMMLIFGSVTGLLLLRPMPMTEQAGSVLLTIIGMLIGKVGTIVDFYFGSNKDSKDKDATIAAQTATIAASSPGVATNGVIESAAWQQALDAGTKEAFNSYLTKYPTGAHAADARVKLAT